jgi:hypothetical protein
MKYYGLKSLREIFLNYTEELMVILMKGLCQIEKRMLDNAIETFVDLEGALLTATTE